MPKQKMIRETPKPKSVTYPMFSALSPHVIAAWAALINAVSIYPAWYAKTEIMNIGMDMAADVIYLSIDAHVTKEDWDKALSQRILELMLKGDKCFVEYGEHYDWLKTHFNAT